VLQISLSGSFPKGPAGKYSRAEDTNSRQWRQWFCKSYAVEDDIAAGMWKHRLISILRVETVAKTGDNHPFF